MKMLYHVAPNKSNTISNECHKLIYKETNTREIRSPTTGMGIVTLGHYQEAWETSPVIEMVEMNGIKHYHQMLSEFFSWLYFDDMDDDDGDCRATTDVNENAQWTRNFQLKFVELNEKKFFKNLLI